PALGRVQIGRQLSGPMPDANGCEMTTRLAAIWECGGLPPLFRREACFACRELRIPTTTLYQRSVFVFWKPCTRNSRRRGCRILQFKKRTLPRRLGIQGSSAPGMCTAAQMLARLSEAIRMALKATDTPADRPDVRPNPEPNLDPAVSKSRSGVTTPNLNAQLNPEQQELARKREEQTTIETELADRELRSANLRAELGAFERQYLHYVGSRYAELDELKAAIAEQSAKDQPGNDRAQRAAQQARARADETKSSAGEKAAATPRAFEASPEMKKLYREVAKRIHPDLTSDRKDRAKRQQLMAEANEAYERGDEAKLNKIFTEYAWSPDAVQGEGPGAELIRVIRRISQARGRLAEIEAELQELLRSDLHQLKVRVDEAKTHGRDVLKEMISKVDDQIAQAKRRLEQPATSGAAAQLPTPQSPDES
ncbi:MAG: hypothetical protein WA867_04135, partial [Candidatus Acidiferrales bacterium]